MNFYDANIEKKYTFKSIQSILYICLNVVTKTPKTINIAQMTISNSTKERQNETKRNEYNTNERFEFHRRKRVIKMGN